MVKLIVGLRRRPGMSADEFHRYWREVHPPIVQGVTEFFRYVRKYVQSHALGAGLPGFPAEERGYDGFAELWFDTADDVGRAFAEPRYLEVIRPDERKFLDLPACSVTIVEEVPIHPGGEGRTGR
jgi:uncharacterized protein (TIGR02118 family)